MKIFISYSRDDAGNFAQHVHKYLRDIGYDIFIDVNSIRIGDPWAGSIEKNISECNIFVVILTPDSLRSNHVADEVLYAQKENKAIVPCIHEYVNYNEIKWGLEKIQGVEFADKYELAMRLYSKIRNYEENKEPIDDFSESFSKSVETTATAVTPPIKPDTDRLQQQKDLRQPPKEKIDEIIPSKPSEETAAFISRKEEEEKVFSEKDSEKQGHRINLKIIIIPIIAVTIIGLIISINYFNGLPSPDKHRQTITVPATSDTVEIDTISIPVSNKTIDLDGIIQKFEWDDSYQIDFEEANLDSQNVKINIKYITKEKALAFAFIIPDDTQNPDLDRIDFAFDVKHDVGDYPKTDDHYIMLSRDGSISYFIGSNNNDTNGKYKFVSSSISNTLKLKDPFSKLDYYVNQASDNWIGEFKIYFSEELQTIGFIIKQQNNNKFIIFPNSGLLFKPSSWSSLNLQKNITDDIID